MQQLWLSSPALGSCIPNLGRFLASKNSSKIDDMEKSFYWPIYHPLGICHPNLSVRISVTVDMFFSCVRPFLALLLNLGYFGHLGPASTLFLQHFFGSKILANMIKICCHEGGWHTRTCTHLPAVHYLLSVRKGGEPVHLYVDMITNWPRGFRKTVGKHWWFDVVVWEHIKKFISFSRSFITAKNKSIMWY